ncbi:hypothetical protein LINGRAHAP2_LOCUS22924, partial [Linum grandiflorum]
RVQSDHCPVILFLEQNGSRQGRRRFYYEKGWQHVDGYHDVVGEEWIKGKNTNESLKLCSSKLTKWKKQSVGVNREKIQDLNKELERLVILPTSNEIMQQQNDVRKELVKCWKVEEEFWAQRACVNWLRLGDRNTHFFHRSTIQRRRRNIISKLQDELGVSDYDQ